MMWASAVVLVAVAVGAVWAGGWVFAAFAAVAAVLILREWMAMSGPFSLRAAPWALMAFVAVSVVMARTEPLQSLGFAALIAQTRAGLTGTHPDWSAAMVQAGAFRTAFALLPGYLVLGLVLAALLCLPRLRRRERVVDGR